MSGWLRSWPSLKELSYNAENLAEIAADLELTAQVSEPFTRAGAQASVPLLRCSRRPSVAEVLEDSYASEVLELGDDRYVVVKLNKVYSRASERHY